jgi:hypothetical protein
LPAGIPHCASSHGQSHTHQDAQAVVQSFSNRVTNAIDHGDADGHRYPYPDADSPSHRHPYGDTGAADGHDATPDRHGHGRASQPYGHTAVAIQVPPGQHGYEAQLRIGVPGR